MLYSLIVKCPEKKNYVKLFDELPIKDKSNGSIVTIKGEKPWNDYIDVTSEELDNLLEFISKKENKNDYEVKVRKYVKRDLHLLPPNSETISLFL